MNWEDSQKECERLAKQAIKENLDANGILNEQGAVDTLPNLIRKSAIAEQLLLTKAQEELEILIEAYNDRRVSKESFAEILEGYAL